MKSVKEPAYYEIIASDIERDIQNGSYVPGDMLASENGLAKLYATSRVTVRKSLSLLEDAGYIKPQQGKGYFVCKPEHERFSLNFSETAEGYTSSFHYIHAMRADAQVAHELELEPGQFVLGICRILRKDTTPVAVDYKFIPYEKGRPLVESEIDYAIFPEIAAIQAPPFAMHTAMEFAAELPNSEVRELLSCKANTPVLAIYRRLYDLHNHPIGYGVRYQTSEYETISAISGYEGDHDE